MPRASKIWGLLVLKASWNSNFFPTLESDKMAPLVGSNIRLYKKNCLPCKNAINCIILVVKFFIYIKWRDVHVIPILPTYKVTLGFIHYNIEKFACDFSHQDKILSGNQWRNYFVNKWCNIFIVNVNVYIICHSPLGLFRTNVNK